MSKINGMMNIGRGALSNNQRALQTVGHNIANKNTEGYSRQRVEILANPSIPSGPKIQMGAGARTATVSRTNNGFLEKQIQNEGATLGSAKSRADLMIQLEHIYNEQMNKGLNQYVSDFFNAYRELSNEPESLTGRTLVKEAADFVTQDFRRVSRQLEDIQKSVDSQLETQIKQVNAYINEIAELNKRIASIEVGGAHANDERDRRDLVLKKVGDAIGAKFAEGKQGMVAVYVGPAVLVSGVNSYEMQTMNTPDRHRTEIFYHGGATGSLSVQLTDHIRNGEIGGALDVRDRVVPSLLERLDRMATSMATEINHLHREGHDRYGQPGVDLFEIPFDSEHASKEIKVNVDILNDVGRVVAGLKADAPGDNTVANAISALQYQGIVDPEAGTTLDDFYNAMVGEVGTATQRARANLESQDNVMSQLHKIRESISGVSLDEEATKMIEYQKGFDASARLIRTADELLDTVLNLKRY